MRHPAAPTIIAVLLGFLVFMMVWARWRGDGHHEGNPEIVHKPRRESDTEEDHKDIGQATSIVGPKDHSDIGVGER